jgi:hypothetical protein
MPPHGWRHDPLIKRLKEGGEALLKISVNHKARYYRCTILEVIPDSGYWPQVRVRLKDGPELKVSSDNLRI